MKNEKKEKSTQSLSGWLNSPEQREGRIETRSRRAALTVTPVLRLRSLSFAKLRNWQQEGRR